MAEQALEGVKVAGLTVGLIGPCQILVSIPLVACRAFHDDMLAPP